MFKSAHQGVADAQYYLGIMYRDRKGVPRDYKEAFQWFYKAAQQDHAMAQHHVGTMYYRGEGVPQSYRNAVRWYESAGERGVADSQYQLGIMYALGWGVRGNAIISHVWANFAGANGHPYAAILRDYVEFDMRLGQIQYAQNLAKQWQNRKGRQYFRAAPVIE